MAKIKLLQSILINCLIIFVTAVPSSHHSEKCSNESHDCQEALIVQRDPIDPINGIPIAFGDFDSDGLIDVFLLTEDGETIRALKGMDCVDGKASSGSRNCLADRWSSQLECNLYQVVVNLVLSDFNGDNRLDLLVTLKNEDESLDVMLVLGNSLHAEVFTCQKKLLLFEEIHTQPLVLDYDGDMISEFIITYEDCPTYLWNGGISVRDAQHLFESAQSHFHGLAILRQKAICLNLSAQRTFAFAQPHSSAFVNLNHYQYNLSPDIYLNGTHSSLVTLSISTFGPNESLLAFHLTRVFS